MMGVVLRLKYVSGMRDLRGKGRLPTPRGTRVDLVMRKGAWLHAQIQDVTLEPRDRRPKQPLTMQTDCFITKRCWRSETL